MEAVLNLTIPTRDQIRKDIKELTGKYPCDHLLVRGPKKGTHCNNPSDGEYCSAHINSKHATLTQCTSSHIINGNKVRCEYMTKSIYGKCFKHKSYINKQLRDGTYCSEADAKAIIEKLELAGSGRSRISASPCANAESRSAEISADAN